MTTSALWEARLPGGASVWLLECPLCRRLRRRLLMVVDTSDSCAGKSETEARHEVFRILERILRPGDRATIWVLGRSTPAVDIEIGADPGQLLAVGCDRLPPVHGGTWLLPTWKEMDAEARTVVPGERAFLLVVSDGEIFDAAALEGRLGGAGFVNLGGAHAACLPGARTLPLTVAAFSDFLANPWATATVEADLEGGRAVRYSAEGELLDVDPFQVDPDQDTVRIAFVGMRTPPCISVRVAEDTIQGLTPAPLPTPPPDHLAAVLRHLSGTGLSWDEDRLRLLAAALIAGKRPPAIPCPRGHGPQATSRSLFCSQCHSLLVTSDGAGYEDLPSAFRRAARFLLGPDGCPGPAESYGRAGPASASIEGEGDRLWLVLNLYTV